MLRAIGAALTLALLTSSVPVAHADEPAACPEVAPSDGEVTRRLAWIEQRVADNEHQVRHWFTGFAAFQALLIGVELTLLLSAPNDTDRIEPAISLFGATMGLASLFISLPPILGAGDALRSLPRDTPEDRLAALRIAEARLRASAESSSDARSDVGAIVSILYAEAASLTLLFLDQTTSAFLQAGGGIVIGLGRILLHPTGAIDAWRTYAATHEDAGCAPEGLALQHDPAMRFAIAPVMLGRGGGGIGLTLAF